MAKIRVGVWVSVEFGRLDVDVFGLVICGFNGERFVAPNGYAVKDRGGDFVNGIFFTALYK